MELSSFQDKYGLTVNEAVQVMGICERKVRELIKENEIPHFRVGRAVRIPWKPLKEWMDNGGTGGDKR
jgi:excisionase family DNA binding protein